MTIHFLYFLYCIWNKRPQFS